MNDKKQTVERRFRTVRRQIQRADPELMELCAMSSATARRIKALYRRNPHGNPEFVAELAKGILPPMERANLARRLARIRRQANVV